MNTKAQAPATNAPTAKDDNKAGNTKVQFVAVTEKEDNDYQDLHSRHLDLNEEEEARYMELAKKIRAAKNARKAKIDEVKSDLRKMAFSIKDIFAAEDIKAAFQITDLFSQTEIDAAATQKGSGKSGKAGTGNTGAKKGTTRASDGEIELFFFPKSGNRGDRDLSLKRGRINERYNDTVATPFIINEANFPKKLLAHATSEKELMKFISPKDKAAAEDYLKTEEGKAEVAKILEVVTKASEKLNPSGAGSKQKAA